MAASVLVVEDDRELRDLVRRYLERAGHAVQTTGTGAEALGMLSNGGIDLMVLDLGLPDVDGLDLLDAAHGPGSDVPVVVLTARSGVQERIEGLRHGAEFSGYERTVDSHVKNLRRKLGTDGADIVTTVLGAGYRLGWSRDA